MAATRMLIKAREGDVCTCGCKGDDPWHDSHYKRVVRVTCPSKRKDLGNGRFSVASGTARFPWGVETVRQVAQVIDGKEYLIGWEIVK